MTENEHFTMHIQEGAWRTRKRRKSNNTFPQTEKCQILFDIFPFAFDILPFVDIIKTDIHLQEAIVCQKEFL